MQRQKYEINVYNIVQCSQERYMNAGGCKLQIAGHICFTIAGTTQPLLTANIWPKKMFKS